MSDQSSGPASRQADRASAWSLIRPYWVSEERKTAWGLLVAIVAMDLILVGINARLNTWNRDFYNALEGRKVHDFPQLMLLFSALAFAFVGISVYNRYLRQMLGFRWRQWLTTRYLQEWLGDGTFYRIERDRLTDNPDQRIAVDLASFATTTLSLTLDLLSTLETLVWFSTVLWSTAGALAIEIGGTPFQIPGYMLWAAVVYAIAGSVLTNKVGHPLVSINYQLQRVEADFRFGLIRLRENAEQIAFYDGMRTEASTAQDLFGRIRENWWRVMKYTRRYSFVLNFYGQIAEIFPIAVASPRYFAGLLSFGTLMQIGDAFSSVSESLSWFINNYDTLVQWRATVNRLREFKRVMQQPHLKESVSPATEHGGINLHYVDESRLATHKLTLALPNGETLASVRDIVVEPGSRWLVRGPSGAGKSTLLRALAGLWPFGNGSIDAPVNARMMFVPQQSYLPAGTLKAGLTYPAAATDFSDEECDEALRLCRLEGYIGRLHESQHWWRILSPGEQQRLAVARVLMHKPDYVFLDEATSALDAANETHLYRLLTERLPEGAIVSVTHRQSLANLHQETLDIARAREHVVAYTPPSST
ncbi:ABC transporter ATP-binding protein [Paraburkholderia caffeinilytica]|uniref:ABC transporter n=1 Tax=Paraburkholderia caffeinilytica TaxID=1761016 RepID=A0ABQ1ND85_9BURK|nr:ABC transporter ATP-binding protein/permease [Paraburkholderia caffeinilytica]AXL48741.1 ABC transporter ATP-binding protein [Paraburkholderia caffeinilytica]GGC72584.1 ABC transporter [Paraburkholderia caffeinilytica]CAB3808061.1 Inner membrane ABC transporter ATP-binding protein YddA [Paraburkholderia caffeinilytica]